MRLPVQVPTWLVWVSLVVAVVLLLAPLWYLARTWFEFKKLRNSKINKRIRDKRLKRIALIFLCCLVVLSSLASLIAVLWCELSAFSTNKDQPTSQITLQPSQKTVSTTKTKKTVPPAIPDNTKSPEDDFGLSDEKIPEKTLPPTEKTFPTEKPLPPTEQPSPTEPPTPTTAKATSGSGSSSEEYDAPLPTRAKSTQDDSLEPTLSTDSRPKPNWLVGVGQPTKKSVWPPPTQDWQKKERWW